MKIAIIGYGRMGKEIEKAALAMKHEVLLKIDSRKELEDNFEELRFCNVAIEFSIPEQAVVNILTCFDAEVPVISGTTGWYEHLPRVKSICEDSEQTLLYSPNFSIGVNILFELNKNLAAMVNKFKSYDVTIDETHHTNKIDKPSGTALYLARDIIGNYDLKTTWVNDKAKRLSELEVHSFREGEVTGIHNVTYKSSSDIIRIGHEAINRQGFAEGAILAAEWVKNKKGVFTMSDFVK